MAGQTGGSRGLVWLALVLALAALVLLCWGGARELRRSSQGYRPGHRDK